MAPPAELGSVVHLVDGGPTRRRHPFLFLVIVFTVVGLIAWLWYSVFSPLFEDPHRWAARERTFRAAIQDVLKGSGHDHGDARRGAVPSLPIWPPPLTMTQKKLVACAEAQVARGVRISGRYVSMSYPWGDLPPYLGGSPDLVVRCLRVLGLDLQQMIHIDLRDHPRRYPRRLWPKHKPDASIDHRRLPNLSAFIRAFAERHAVLIDTAEKRARFLPGDLVFWTPAGTGEYPGLVGFVLDRRDAKGVPRVVTLVPREKFMSDRHGLDDWRVTGHYRIHPDKLLERFLDANPNARLAPRPSR